MYNTVYFLFQSRWKYTTNGGGVRKMCLRKLLWTWNIYVSSTEYRLETVVILREQGIVSSNIANVRRVQYIGSYTLRLHELINSRKPYGKWRNRSAWRTVYRAKNRHNSVIVRDIYWLSKSFFHNSTRSNEWHQKIRPSNPSIFWDKYHV